MGKFDILNNGVPYSMDKTKNYVKQADNTIAEIADLTNLQTTEVGFIGHKANIHKSELTDRNISVLDEKINTKVDKTTYTANDVLTKIKTVDGTGSGLDADTLDGYNSSVTNTVSTVVIRDASGYANLTGLNLTAGSETSAFTWNSIDGTFDLGMLGDVNLQLGQELHIYAKATEAISNGQVVMFAGAQGDHTLISKATTAGLNANSRYLVGVATQNFNTNDFGYVTWFGNVNGINTSAWAEGSILYFNHSVAGGLTTTVPTAPNAKITVAAVLRQHATEGTLLIRPDLGSKLDDLHNVAISSGVSGDSLYFDGTKWVNTPAYTKAQVDTALGLKANLASPTLTGTPTAPTASAGTNTTQIATTAFVLANGTSTTNIFPTSYFDISQLISGSVITLSIPNIFAYVNTTFVNIASVSIDISATTYWDNSTYATAANRAGKDFYIYVLTDGTIKLSINSTYPTGSDADNSRKIGGFHCLCNSVGTISGHTLSGYVTGNILPMSVWDLYNRSVAGNEGMVKMPNGKWVDIYLPSWNGTKLVSVYGGTIADGTSSPAFHCYKFEQKFGEIGKDTISQRNFVVASLGSNQGTNVTGGNDKGTTGGWTDTAGRRMISNIGCEDMAGLMWQWCSDIGGNMTSASWANAYDGNDSGVAGQHYQAPYRGLLGSGWDAGVYCGSRGSLWGASPLVLGSYGSARGCSEPSKNKLV